MDKQFELLNELINKNPDKFDISTGATTSAIENAEEYLGFKFPETLKLYLKTWGTIAIGSVDFLGITGDNFLDCDMISAVQLTKLYRTEINLPHHLLIILNHDGDEYDCIDLLTGEIVVWSPIFNEIVGVRDPNLFQHIFEETLYMVQDDSLWDD